MKKKNREISKEDSKLWQKADENLREARNKASVRYYNTIEMAKNLSVETYNKIIDNAQEHYDKIMLDSEKEYDEVVEKIWKKERK